MRIKSLHLIIRPILPILLALPGLLLAQPGRAADAAAQKIPAILDTDIGDDIDDTWALAFLLRSPELDLKLVVGDYGRPQYRARLLARLLQQAGRTDVAVGVGIEGPARGEGRQADWIKGYELKAYPGKVHEDGVAALIDTIMKSPQPITLICIGPVPNIAEALKREPRIAERARFVGMHGSVHVGYGGSKTPSAEWNVKADAKACQAAFTAPWEMTITPLDTCGLIQLKGEKYKKVHDSKDPLAMAVIENYRAWATDPKKKDQANPAESHSTTLYDTVAVYLAFSQQLCAMERMGLRVTDDGFTRIDPAAKQVNVAARWKDMGAFEDLLVARLTGGK